MWEAPPAYPYNDGRTAVTDDMRILASMVSGSRGSSDFEVLCILRDVIRNWLIVPDFVRHMIRRKTRDSSSLQALFRDVEVENDVNRVVSVILADLGGRRTPRGFLAVLLRARERVECMSTVKLVRDGLIDPHDIPCYVSSPSALERIRQGLTAKGLWSQEAEDVWEEMRRLDAKKSERREKFEKKLRAQGKWEAYLESERLESEQLAKEAVTKADRRLAKEAVAKAVDSHRARQAVENARAEAAKWKAWETVKDLDTFAIFHNLGIDDDAEVYALPQFML